ncbi:MAG: hypothetical protein RMJ84_00045 [Sandaracinaceae bacterium]|nr:hypothetical protein [Sandaracinaceae bacterium]
MVEGVLLFALFGCEEPPPPTFLHTITVIAQGDPGEFVPGVKVFATLNGQKKEIGVTDSNGMLVYQVRAPNGTLLPLEAVCPDTHRLVRGLAPIRLETMQGAAGESTPLPGFELKVQCLPKERDAVVVVRATGTNQVSGISVLVNGREVTRIEEGGSAHVPLRYPPNTTFRVELVAAAVSPHLQPQNAVRDFTMPDEDAYLLFEQSYTLALPPPPPPPPKKKPRPIKREEVKPQPVRPVRLF